MLIRCRLSLRQLTASRMRIHQPRLSALVVSTAPLSPSPFPSPPCASVHHAPFLHAPAQLRAFHSSATLPPIRALAASPAIALSAPPKLARVLLPNGVITARGESVFASRGFLAPRRCEPASAHGAVRWGSGESSAYRAIGGRGGGEREVVRRNAVAHVGKRGEGRGEEVGSEGGVKVMVERGSEVGNEEGSVEESEGGRAREWWEEEFSELVGGEDAGQEADEGGEGGEPLSGLREGQLGAGDAEGAEEDPQRAAVVGYLECEGVDAELVAEVALPLDVGVVRERVAFLRSLGLDVPQVVGRYPAVLCGSITRNYIPVLSFLETIPIPRAHLPALLSAYPRVLFSSVRIDLQPLLHYLQGLGIPPAALGSVLSRCPVLLGLRPEGTMSTSVAYLVGIGVDPKAVGGMLLHLPHLLTMRVATSIRPKVTLLAHRLAMPLPVVAQLLQARPQLLALDLEGQLLPALNALQSAGLSVPHMRSAVSAFPHLLALPLTDLLPPTLQWLASHAHLPPSSLPAVVAGLPQVVVADRGQMGVKLQLLRDRGFSQHQVAALVAGCPQVLGQRVETIDRKLSLLLAHRTHADVAAFPPCLACREAVLEGRLRVAREGGVGGSLEWLLGCSDSTFEHRLTSDIVALPPPVELVAHEAD